MLSNCGPVCESERPGCTEEESYERAIFGVDGGFGTIESGAPVFPEACDW